jgi:hypothetical protein
MGWYQHLDDVIGVPSQGQCSGVRATAAACDAVDLVGTVGQCQDARRGPEPGGPGLDQGSRRLRNRVDIMLSLLRRCWW